MLCISGCFDDFDWPAISGISLDENTWLLDVELTAKFPVSVVQDKYSRLLVLLANKKLTRPEVFPSTM